MRIVLVGLLVAGCVTRTYHSTPAQLVPHEAELVERGYADVETVEGEVVRVRADTPLLVHVPGASHTIDKARCVKVPALPLRACVGQDHVETDADTPRHVVVRDLVSGCHRGSCLATQLRDEGLPVAKRTGVKWEAVTRTIAAAAIVGISTLCMVECEPDAGYTVAGVGGFAALVLLTMPVALLMK